MGVIMRKGIVFTIDALISLLIILMLIPLLVTLFFKDPYEQTSVQSLHSQAQDAVDVLSKTDIKDVREEPAVQELFSKGVLADEDLNLTLMDVLAGLWATQDPVMLQHASNLTRDLLSPLMPKELKWGLEIEGDLIYNSSRYNETQIRTASRKIASGFARNRSSTGYSARAFLEKIIGREDNSYFFFGGFVGEGNLTAAISDVPQNSTIMRIYLEVNSESNFSMYLNGNPCAKMNISSNNFSVENWTIPSLDPCVSQFIPGAINNFSFSFDHPNITKHFFGGGFLRVTFSTNQFSLPSTGVKRHPFPGINGLLNLYDSFYVPGNITSMNAFIRLYSNYNYTTLGFIGNTSFLNHSGNNQTEDIIINNTEFEALFAAEGISYIDLSKTTMPLRLLTGANITGGKLNGTVDVVLITDVSGSMNWRMNSDFIGGSIRNCDDPLLGDPSTQRLSVAKCLDKDFARAILGANNSACGTGFPIVGNRVALVDFSSSVQGNTSLITDLVSLENEIDSYFAGGGTCLSCAINRAWEILNSQSSPERQKYVIAMTDGVTNYRSTTACENRNGISSSDVNSFLALSVGDGGAADSSSGHHFKYFGSLTSQNLNAIGLLNSTFGFAVANGGEIYFWDGSSWGLSQDVGSTTFYSIDIWNGTFAFAGGSNGGIYFWDGSSWGLYQNTGSHTWYSIVVVNGSRAFAGTTSGLIWRWDGVNWAQDVDLGSMTIYSLDAWNSALALAGTSGERFYRWDGDNWNFEGDLGGSSIYGISFLNATLAFGVSSAGEVHEWNNGALNNVYRTPDGRSLNSLFMLNATSGYAVGDYARVVLWDGGAWNVSAIIERAYSGNGIAGNYCYEGYYDSCGTFMNQSYAAMNANYSAGRIASSFNNVTGDSIGFGPIGTCKQANETLQAIADTGRGTFYASSNASELRNIYCQIAQNINIKSTPTQEITFSGNITQATLYPESYIELYYFPTTPEPVYKEIGVTTETSAFPECTGSFFIPPISRIIDAKLTSYSGNYWTSGAYLNSSLTAGFVSVFNLSSFDLPYLDLGDPFHVYLPVELLGLNETNYVRDELGLNQSYPSANCSDANRVIYTSMLKASTSYGKVFPGMRGRNVTIYYDSDHDGIADGFTYVAFGTNLTNFDPNPVDVEELDPVNDAMDNAIAELLDQLNYVILPINSGRGGELTNPIDIIIGGEINAQTNVLQLVPIPWGPVDITVIVGV